MSKAPPLEELTRYRIEPKDEGLHPYDPEVEWIGPRAGTIQALGAEIDITHTFVPPQRSLYRRSPVRIHLEDAGEPLMGWCEANRRKELDASAKS